jgi:hypothetical protein
MYTPTNKTQCPKGKAVADLQGRRADVALPVGSFLDNRNEAIVQRKLLALSRSSAEHCKVATLQARYRFLADKTINKDVAQRVKNSIPENQIERNQFIQKFRDLVKQNVVKDKQGNELAKAILVEASEVYNTSRVRGEELWKNLSSLILKYQANTQPSASTTSSKEAHTDPKIASKRKEYDKRFKENYFSSLPEKTGTSSNRYRVMTSSDTSNAAEKSYEYINYIDFSKGSIETESNYAYAVNDDDWTSIARDQARKNGVGLHNSEILWQQAKLAAQTHSPQGSSQEIEGMLKNISSIKRQMVENHETLVVMNMAYPDNKYWMTPYEFLPTTPEFFAVLGTPNVRSSACFLIDHFDQLVKTIEKIVINDGIEIVFKKID